MKRNTSIEVYRCMLMFGIVLLHCCSQGPIRLMIPYRLCMSCVTGFVFISGYFGIRFAWGKVFSLIMTAVVCATISFTGERLLNLPSSGYGFVEYLITGNWFLWSYVVLMMFAPMMERALSVDDAEEHAWRWAIPLLFIVFGWNFLSSMPMIGKLLPRPVGFGTHTFLMMIGVYLAARLFKKYDIERLLVGWKLWIPLGVGGGLCAMGLSHYDSPVSFIFMACLFTAFKRLSFGCVGKLAALLGPSIFSVYLLHWSPMGLNFLNYAENCGIDMIGQDRNFIIAFMTAAMLFVGAVIIDFPRRLLWTLCGDLSRKKMNEA